MQQVVLLALILASFLLGPGLGAQKSPVSPQENVGAEEEPGFVLGTDSSAPQKTTFGELLKPRVSRFNLNPLDSATPSAYQPVPTPVKPSSAYTIILVGDSMTDYLGENAERLGGYLKEYYPSKTFGIFNYGFGSTNILSVKERLEEETIYRGRTYPPILGRQFDLILIESFGHNPLSDYSLSEGLQKQTEALDYIVERIRTTRPYSAIAFVATISPSRERYAQGIVDLAPEDRERWAQERLTYIANHIQYAQQYNIPLVNIFEKSVNEEGSANLNLINPADYIHPSVEGVDFISKEIAKFIYETEILPH